ncbi:MAG: GNAT family N-acetyltransferase [Gammaproteobacteria bacterium]|nr:MAG: GNAT family N-acetyltransferase [Gammaproteobacteria bacterium]
MDENIAIRDAKKSDAEFLSWVILEAAHSGHDLSFWEAIIPESQQERLEFIRYLSSSVKSSVCYYENFIIAEEEFKPISAISAYNSSIITRANLIAALYKAQARFCWDHKRVERVRPMASAFISCIPQVPDNCWVIEWVATRHEYRRQGIVKYLLKKILLKGLSESNCNQFQINFAIDNTPARTAYEGVGFRYIDENRNEKFAEYFGYPGIARMQITREELEQRNFVRAYLNNETVFQEP